MRWDGVLAAIYVAMGQAELWGWTEAAPDPAPVELQLALACALSRSHLGKLESAWSAQRHQEAVQVLQSRIHEGDFYVANLCVPFEAPFRGDPVTLALSRFRVAQPPFGAFLSFESIGVLALSMERLLAKQGGRLWSEPIKGSTLLVGDAELDASAAAALLADPKERAEHTMIVDLVRNDLGRVATPGSVKVAVLMEPRVYPTVQHLVSRVEADLEPGTGLAALLRAVLPGGSVTGAPKHAVCSHLSQAEAAPRGFYCGALGWIGPKGECLDLALPIRTAQLSGERLTYWAGGGITRRSAPEKEWQELLLKTKVMNLP
jgi:anthranilate/para-aminobenzoate synthase component I